MGTEICSTCGHPLSLSGHCPACRGWLCPVCEKPAYRDESVVYGALGQVHIRCSSGVARERPEWMAVPELVGEADKEHPREPA